MNENENQKCIKCHIRNNNNGTTWCNRCEMAYRAWQVEMWDKHRINNADAIIVYGFKSRIDMELSWQEAHLIERENQYKYKIVC